MPLVIKYWNSLSDILYVLYRAEYKIAWACLSYVLYDLLYRWSAMAPAEEKKYPVCIFMLTLFSCAITVFSLI